MSSKNLPQILSKLDTLEKQSAQLDPPTQQWKDMAHLAVDYCKKMISSVDTAKAFNTFDPDQVIQDADTFLSDFPEHVKNNDAKNEDGGKNEKQPHQHIDRFQEILTLLDKHVLNHGYHAASGKMMGYVGGGGQIPSAVGDMLADVTNVFPGHFTINPGLAAMELELIRLLGKIVGFADLPPPSPHLGKDAAGNCFGGLLTSGGSMATFSAIVTARETMRIAEPGAMERYLSNNKNSRKNHSNTDEQNNNNKFVVYCTKELHSCFFKALNLAGCGAKSQLVKTNIVKHDHNYRMDIDDLRMKIESDIEEGHAPWLIAASAGTVNIGSVDPLDEIADIAKEFNCFFHVDGAYGGLFTLCEIGREKLRGIERADSLVIDPHKGMFLPYGTAALLVKDVRWLAAAHSFEAAYLTNFLEEDKEQQQQQQQEKEKESSSSSISEHQLKANAHLRHLEKNLFQSDELGPELSKHSRAPRLWLPLQLYGIAPFRAAVEEKILLARYASDLFATKPEWFQLAVRHPDLSILAFKVVKKSDNRVADLTKLLLAKLNERGNYFLSGTNLDHDGNAFYLRMAIIVFRTHKTQIDGVFEEICACVEEL